MSLARGELAAAITEHRIQPVGQIGYEFLHRGDPHGFKNLLLSCIGGHVADIVSHRHPEQHVLLQRNGNIASQGVYAVLAHIPAV